MFDYLRENIGTIVVLFVLAAIVALIVVKLIRDKKRGKGSCSCGCSSCPMSGNCHKPSEPEDR